MKRAGYILLVTVLTLFSCSRREPKFSDTPKSGVIIIASDESFAPIVEQEVDLFEYTYPEASIIPIYKSEVEAMELLLSDSVQFADRKSVV